MILLSNELSRKHPGLNAGSLGKVVQLPKLQSRRGRSGPLSSSSIAPDELALGQVVLDQVCAPTNEQLQRALSLRSVRSQSGLRVLFPELRVLPERPAWLAIPERHAFGERRAPRMASQAVTRHWPLWWSLGCEGAVPG